MAPRIASIRPDNIRMNRRYFQLKGDEKMKHTDISEIFKNSSLLETQVTVCGWVRTSRDSKSMAFIELNDNAQAFTDSYK